MSFEMICLKPRLSRRTGWLREERPTLTEDILMRQVKGFVKLKMAKNRAFRRIAWRGMCANVSHNGLTWHSARNLPIKIYQSPRLPGINQVTEWQY
jgi:hypothetical protein